jgi:hypothetical protein
MHTFVNGLAHAYVYNVCCIRECDAQTVSTCVLMMCVRYGTYTVLCGCMHTSLPSASTLYAA